MDLPEIETRHPELNAINQRLFKGGKTCDHIYELGRLSVKAEASGDDRLIALIATQMGIYRMLESQAEDDGR